jgi:hypothetical protein
MNNEKENIFLRKINNECIDFFDKCINIFESDNENKEIFYYFLYNDLININKNKNNIINFKNINIRSIIDDPINIIKDYFEDIKSKINIEYLDEFKKNIINKQNEIKKKILECDNHINTIKKIYSNIYIKKFLPINSKDNTIFQNKSVLLINNYNYQYKLGLFFAKIIFCLIKIKKGNDDSLLKTYFNNFFDVNNYHENYLDAKENINEFNNIDINFKYWVILVFLTGQFFSTDSNYYYIFNNLKFEEHISKLCVLQKSVIKNKKHKKDKKSKKKSGGGNISEKKKDINEKKDEKKDEKKNIKKSALDPIKFYNIVLKNTFIDNSNKSLYDIYYINFKENMKKYFIKDLNNYFDNYSLTENNSNHILLNNPFDKNKEKLKLEDITDFKNKKIEKDNIKNVFNNLKYNIFNFLKIYLNSENIEITNNFLSEVKKYIILLLFYLYNLKKKIYKDYLEITSEVFNISENNKTKKNNNKKSTENKKSIENKKNNSPLNIQIKKLENNIEILKSQKNISNYHDKILKLENNIKKLIIRKYLKK